MVGMGVNRDTTNLKTVTFQFQEPPESVSMLRQLMVPDTSVQMVGIYSLMIMFYCCNFPSEWHGVSHAVS